MSKHIKATPKKNQVAVVIPMYKSEMTPFEQKSFEQCIKILGHYPIVIIKPESLDLEHLKQSHAAIQFQNFEDKYFKGIEGYNALLTTVHFYEAFLAYEYMLIYQLDAFIFSDQLTEWCNAGFDYVGSPHIEPERWKIGDKLPGNYHQFRRVFMNGGFSLRRVKAMIRFLKILKFFKKEWISNEDGLFSLHFIQLRPYRPLLRLPNWQQALQFGFEQHPQLCYQLNNQQLPFGCHAWEKYDYGFWEKYMK